MADVQLENGFVRIATELYNALCNLRIPGEARQVFDTIVRFTYGYNQSRNTISMRQFVETTGLSKVAICKAIKKLNEINVIVTQKGNVTKLGNRIAGTYWIQKNYDKWKPLPKKVIVTQKGKNPLPNRRGSIDNTNKDNTNKDNTPPEMLLDLWNKKCFSLPKALKLTPRRIAHIKNRLKEIPSLDDWGRIFEIIQQSPFCNGKSSSGWRASFDWIIANPDNPVKVLEGKYTMVEQKGLIT